MGDGGRAVRPDRSCPPVSFVSCRFRCGGGLDADKLPGRVAANPLGRVGRPEEVA